MHAHSARRVVAAVALAAGLACVGAAGACQPASAPGSVEPAGAPAATDAPSSARESKVSTCELVRGPCLVEFSDGLSVELTVSPLSINADAPLTADLRFASPQGDVEAPRLTLLQATLESPPVVVAPKRTSPSETDRYRSVLNLPPYAGATMMWQMNLEFAVAGAQRNVVYAFSTMRTASGIDIVAVGHDSMHGAAPTAPTTGTPVASDDERIDAELDTTTGKLSFAALRGRVVLVAFGFTSCPDVCPTTMARIASTLKRLTPDEQAAVVPVFISVDPVRDTPAKLAAYVRSFDARIIGATGSTVAIDKAVASFHGSYVIQPPEPGKSADNYVVDHVVTTFVVDRAGHITDKLAHGSSPDEFAAALRKALAQKS